MSLILATSGVQAQGASLSGRVLDARGKPIGGAQVFLEQGIAGQLHVTESRADGAYGFDDLLPGLTGVFAFKEGHAFGGASVRVAIADVRSAVDIRLREAGMLSGTVEGADGRPVEGARITRAGLRDARIGIPLAKLTQYGFDELRTDANGRFEISSLPRGEPVDLKIAHGSYAQEGATGMKVGDRSAKITLNYGVRISGNVLARGSDAAVSNATIYFKNVDPPNGTVVARAGGDGTFSLRLKPGAYYYDASGATYRSPNLQRLIVTGQYQTQQVTLRVAGIATIAGKVKDAVTGEPVRDARLQIESYGLPAGRTRTGPTGEFEFAAAEGEVVVRLEQAPGYLNPPDSGMRITSAAGRTTDLPTFWVAPIPKYALEVVDQNNEPVAGAVVRVLRPATFGWRATDENGIVNLTFASIPPDGSVVGLAEHPDLPHGAIFAITRDRSEDAIVKLAPLSTVRGKVVSDSGKALAGAIVEARFTGESFSDTLVLWRTLSSRAGTFEWRGIAQGVPQWCIAAAENKDGQAVESAPEAFIVNEPRAIDLGPITVENGRPSDSMLGKKLNWTSNKLLCGEEPDRSAAGPAVLVYVGSERATLAAEGLAEAQRILGRNNLAFALIVDGEVPCPVVPFPVLSGKPPALASTYLLDAEGVVVLECVGLPPVFGINEIAPRSR